MPLALCGHFACPAHSVATTIQHVDGGHIELDLSNGIARHAGRLMTPFVYWRRQPSHDRPQQSWTGPRADALAVTASSRSRDFHEPGRASATRVDNCNTVYRAGTAIACQAYLPRYQFTCPDPGMARTLHVWLGRSVPRYKRRRWQHHHLLKNRLHALATGQPTNFTGQRADGGYYLRQRRSRHHNQPL